MVIGAKYGKKELVFRLTEEEGLHRKLRRKKSR
jgi:hypothetical protein